MRTLNQVLFIHSRVATISSTTTCQKSPRISGGLHDVPLLSELARPVRAMADLRDTGRRWAPAATTHFRLACASLAWRYTLPMKFPMDGGCRCERVRIRLSKAPLMTTACHCLGCQRMSASAFSLTAICGADSFEVTRGEPVIGGLHGADAHHFFCAYCMTWLFTRPEPMPEIVNVRPTMLDEHAWFAPFMETFTKTKLPWAVTGARHSFHEFPPVEAYKGLMQEFSASALR
jgi:hypothetical protein